MANVLIASLGESPVVVTAMYSLLNNEAEEHRIDKIDEVVVLLPTGDKADSIGLGYDLVEEIFKQEACVLTPLPLPFDDTIDEQTSFTFLQILSQRLDFYQKNGDCVYLSLAGGRKNISALMGIVVPLFTCVKKLYHVLDKHEDNFLSVEEIYAKSDDERLYIMRPELDRLELVPIPFGEHQYVSDEFRARLFTITDEELDDLWEEDPAQADAIELAQNITYAGKVLEVLVTAHVARTYKKMFNQDIKHTIWTEKCFGKMRFANKLRRGVHGNFSTRSSRAVFHFYKSGRTPVRPFFHSEPKDINACPDNDVERVIISELEIERGDNYRQGEEILQSLKFPLTPTIPVEDLPSKRAKEPLGSILIVPLGKSPMIATQLYTLLKSEGSNIREVVLIYPELSREVRASAKFVMEAFKYEREGVLCWEEPVTGLKDVNSEQACKQYQEVLEKTIKTVRDKHPGWQIELSLSGGRKGMAVLAMFVAQKMGIRHVYHTLIKDKELARNIDKQTDVKALDKLKVNDTTRNNRLFLRAYEMEGEEPHAKFALLKIPVLPPAR